MAESRGGRLRVMTDVLASVLTVTQLGNTVLCQSELARPWGLEIDATMRTAVHLVQRGLCWLRMDALATPLRLMAGDLVLVTRGDRHEIVDDPRTPALPYEEALAALERRRAAGLLQTTQDSTVLLCAGYEFCSTAPHPLLSVLPGLIHVSADQAARCEQLQLMVRLLQSESHGQMSGTDLVVPRLVDTLLVFIVRAWLASQPEGAAGWLGALRDPSIGRAIARIHEQPEHPWTVAELAREAAQSRATFARRFVELVGEPPLAYVTRWRMSLAVKLLRTTDHTIDEIALRAGYESAPAFGKAFRRRFQQSPGQFRGTMAR